MVLRSKKRLIFIVVISVALVTILLNVFVFGGPFYKDVIFYVAIVIILLEFRNIFNIHVEENDPFLILLQKQYEQHDKVVKLVAAKYIEGWNRYSGGLVIGMHELYFEAHPESAYNYKKVIPIYEIEGVGYRTFLGIKNGIKITMKNGKQHSIYMFDSDTIFTTLQQRISLEQGVV